jgi:D-threo-aldose 1-dehydrogenase
MDGKPYFKNTEPVNPVFDFSYDGTMRSIEESLQRLGLDRIDIALIHDPDDHFSEALRGAYRALDKLRSEGTVGAIGVGTNHVAPLVNFARVAKFDCFLLAGRYTLLDQSGLSALLPLCQELGIAVILGGVFNSGILARPDSSAPYDYRPPDDFVRARVQRLSEICRSFAVTLPAAALQFPLGHPAVAAVVVGCRSASEVEENLAAFSAKVPAGVWDEIRASDLVDPLAPYPS